MTDASGFSKARIPFNRKDLGKENDDGMVTKSCKLAKLTIKGWRINGRTVFEVAYAAVLGHDP